MQIILVGSPEVGTRMLAGFLVDLGHGVVRQSSLADLLGLPDASCCDVVIAYTAGNNGCRHLREFHKRRDKVPVILIADAMQLTVEEALDCGVYAYLHQPFSLAEVELHLRNLAPEHSEATSTD